MNSIVLIVVTCLSLLQGISCDDNEIKAVATLTGANVQGSVTFTQKVTGGAVDVHVNLEGLTPNGKFGFHIHEKGDLTNGCTSLGAHYNPDKHNHGGPNATVRHIGDLGNIASDSNGKVLLKFTDPIISLVGPRTIIGRGVIVHEGEDDLGLGGAKDSLTTGNAGGRKACGVIGIQSLIDEMPTGSAVKRTFLGSTLMIALTTVLVDLIV